MRRPGQWPLAAQLALAFALVTVLALGGSGALLLYQSSARLLAGRAESTLAWGQAAAGLAAEYWSDPREGMTLALYRFHQQSGIRPVVVDTDGRVVADVSSETPLLGERLTHPELQAALAGRTATGTRRLSTGEWVMYGGVPVVVSGEQVGAVLVAAGIGAVRDAQRDLLRQLALVAGAMAALAVLLGVLLARYLTRPLVRLRAAVARLARGQLDARVEPGGSSELRDLGHGFNRMAEELGRLDQQRRAFVADASHELRTPIAAIRALAEPLLSDRPIDVAVYKEHLHDIVHECERAGRLVNSLLELARLDMRAESRSQVSQAAEPIDLRRVAVEVVHALEPLAAERGVRLAILPGEPVMARADAHLVEAVLGNLVENGIKYTPRGGAVQVSVGVNVDGDRTEGGASLSAGSERAGAAERRRRAGGERDGAASQRPVAWIKVADTGIGIPKEHQARIFERFYRVDKARSRATGGAGLGLAIAAEAAARLGGRIHVASESGRGSEFTFTLPL
ncbi:signal transduction histidine kinase [Symbiobacterium terraclitae]|uniref:histidine kinase n=1 Tax=Symbiobacterium terraclitae TaxID=557451 RepID=A0ABS4JWV9_9FIRM|nr:signal transduction histidine kinase [Symbiobacterium terraclitae]